MPACMRVVPSRVEVCAHVAGWESARACAAAPRQRPSASHVTAARMLLRGRRDIGGACCRGSVGTCADEALPHAHAPGPLRRGEPTPTFTPGPHLSDERATPSYRFNHPPPPHTHTGSTPALPQLQAPAGRHHVHGSTQQDALFRPHRHPVPHDRQRGNHARRSGRQRRMCCPACVAGQGPQSGQESITPRGP
eukprot:356594-Chlamydomonas_euryale.AAC.3